VLHGGYLVLFGFESCSVAANEPGSPPNEAVCERFVSFPGLAIVALLALAGLALAAHRPWFAWPSWALATATTLLFGFSLGMLVYHCAAVLAAIVVEEIVLRRRRAPAA